MIIPLQHHGKIYILYNIVQSVEGEWWFTSLFFYILLLFMKLSSSASIELAWVYSWFIPKNNWFVSCYYIVHKKRTGFDESYILQSNPVLGFVIYLSNLFKQEITPSIFPSSTSFKNRLHNLLVSSSRSLLINSISLW